jgi:hypothetical protein
MCPLASGWASTLREKFLHERRKLQKDFWALISQAIDD